MMWSETPYVRIVCIVIIFKIKDVSPKYPAKIFVPRSILHRRNIYRSVITEGKLTSSQILDHKDDRVSYLLLVCLRQTKHNDQLITISASAVNSLRQKCKKHTLVEAPPYMCIGNTYVCD